MVKDSGAEQVLEVPQDIWQAITWAPGMRGQGKIDMPGMVQVPVLQIGTAEEAEVEGVAEVRSGRIVPLLRVVVATSPLDLAAREDDERITPSLHRR
jgi:hypothetical protein